MRMGKPNTDVCIDNKIIQGPERGIPIRMYTPDKNETYPMLIFYHGGGFVAGSLEEFEPFCTRLAADASCIVVSVDYRLSPEHKYPAPVDDAVTAMNWICAHARELHGDPNLMAVIGDSAGANLAAVVSFVAREQGYPNLVLQVLICAWVDSSSFETDSFSYFGDGLWLSKASMCWYRDHYLETPGQALLPRVSPLLEKDVAGLPPALLITAEFDVLRDQAEAFANRLREAGVPVQHTRYPGMLHDFVVMPGLFDQANVAIDEISTALRMAFARNK
jgi:acetyl esterase